MGSPLDYPADITESEFDCLNLFITRPAATALQQAGCNGVTALPVLVWIHGGGYAWGAGSDPVWGNLDPVVGPLSISGPLLISARSHAADSPICGTGEAVPGRLH